MTRSLLLLFTLSVFVQPLYGDDRPTAGRILSDAGVQGGLVVHLDCGDGRLTAAIGADDRYLVHGLDADPNNVRAAREHVRSLGLYGRVSIDLHEGGRLPYADNLVNLAIVDDASPVPQAEIMRVLAPLGVALVKTENGGYAKTVKPWPEAIDQWTHHLHDPGGTAVGNDRVVGPPRHVQWIAPPRWQRHHELTPSLGAMVSSGGRLFAVINDAPAGIDGLPDRWTLVARDAFNGKLLWKRPIAEWGWKEWGDHSYGHGRWNHPTHVARRLVAVGDRVYVTLGFNAPLSALDAATGQTRTTYSEVPLVDEVLYENGRLLVVENVAPTGPGRIENKPPVGKAVVAMDAESGDVLWRTAGFTGAASKADAIERVTHLTMVAGGGRVFVVEEDALVALDAADGSRAWSNVRPKRPRPVTYGSYYFTNLCSPVYHDGLLFFMEPDATVKHQQWNAPTKARLSGIDAATGNVLWTRDCGLWGHYNEGDVFPVAGLVWVHAGEGFSMMGLDPKTGRVARTISTERALDQGHHHRCYRNKATPNYFVTGRRGTEFIDVESEENLRHHWVRGTCRYGVLPCNGLLYAPPHPCICYVTSKLNGFWALAPRRKANGADAAPAEDRPALVRGPAPAGGTSSPADGPEAALDVWPTYRHDAARSGCADTEVGAELKPLWTTQLGGRPSSPTVAGGRVFVALPDAHAVCALDAADGKPIWSFTAGSRVDTPPTVYRGTILFGSADGVAYCLRAADGQVVWRRRAAPREARIVSHGRLESPWPVHGGVLVQNDTAYFAAGRSSFLDGGIYVFAVDPATGNLLHEARIDSVDPATGDMADGPLPYDMPADAPGALPDVLVGDGTSFFMRHLQFDPRDLSHRNASKAFPPRNRRGMYPYLGGHLMSVAGLLDDGWFSQTYWTLDGNSPCKLMVFDKTTAYGVKPFAATARHDRAIFRPGTNGYTLFAAGRPGHARRWAVKVPVRVTAMVLAGKTLLAAGTPDVVPADDPWAALEGRAGGRLLAVSAVDGKTLGGLKLDGPPVYDGMAAVGGRVFLVQKNGNIVCLGRRL